MSRSKLTRPWIGLICLAIFAGVLPSAAQADILFLDFNDSLLEVQHAQAVARAQHERIFVYPNLTPHERLEIKRSRFAGLAKQKWLDHAQELRQPATIAKAETAVADAEKQYRENLKGGVTAKGLDEFLTQIEADSNVNLNTLVISAHHAREDFWGSFTYNISTGKSAKVTFDQLFDTISRHPRTNGSLRSVILLACYSATRSQVLRWATRFPELTLIFGFDGSGPAGDFAYSYKLLEGVLLKRASLSKAASTAEVTHSFRAVPYATATETAAMFGKFYVTRDDEAISLDLEAAGCDWGFAKIMDKQSVFEGYFFATAAENVPVQEGASDLRSYYDLIQKYAHCKLGISVPKLEVVAALIHFREVQRQYARAFGPSLVEIDEGLRRMDPGAPMISAYANPQASRRKVIDGIQAVQAFLTQHRDAVGTPDYDRVKRQLDWANHLLFGLKCVPMTWITEEDTRPQLPLSCEN